MKIRALAPVVPLASTPVFAREINGNKPMFSLDVDFGNGATTFNHTGVVVGAEIRLHSDFMGRSLDFSIARMT